MLSSADVLSTLVCTQPIKKLNYWRLRMTFVDLVHYFRAGGSFGEFCQSQLLNVDSEVVEIFMAKPLNIVNDIKFFEIEKTEGKIEHTFDGIKYFNMFDFIIFLMLLKSQIVLIIAI